MRTLFATVLGLALVAGAAAQTPAPDTTAVPSGAVDPAASAAAHQGPAAVEHRPGGEVNLRLPDLNQGDFLGFTGHEILLSGLLVCALGLLFGAFSNVRVKGLPVHRSMAEISDLIYETCKPPSASPPPSGATTR